MRYTLPRSWVALAFLVFAIAGSTAAAVPIYVDRGHDEFRELQRRVDRIVGAGRVNVRKDFMGAGQDAPEPWTWVNPGHAMEVTLVDRKSPHYVFGWYAEKGAYPVLDGVEDALLMDQTRPRGTCVGFSLPGHVNRFGFFVSPSGLAKSTPATLWSNRLFNQASRIGSPGAGGVQMLVFDISKWAGADTWLIACETNRVGPKQPGGSDLGSGRVEDGGSDGEDADYSDVLFIVSGGNVTPTRQATFGSLKRLYR